MGFLSTFLEHPLTKGLDIDDPSTTILRRKIIQDKPLLKEIYEEWYRSICENLPIIDGAVLEIGSGAGFLNTYIPNLITTDIMPVDGNDLACTAMKLPFKEKSLRAIVLVNVLHHINNPLLFFKEAERCIKESGALIMIEPWVTPWSRIIYGKLHHEPFNPESSSWILPPSGPLSGGNDALPWIIFSRDKKQFYQQTNWRIKIIKETMPLRYLFSGGISMRSLLPVWMNRSLTWLEKSMNPTVMRKTAMFALVVLCLNTRK